MKNRLDIKKNEISKLKIKRILKNGMIVIQLNGHEGFIHISEISDIYINSISDIYNIGEYVYGVLIKKEDNKYFFSLKTGHTMSKYLKNKHHTYETNGGYLSLMYNMDNFIKK